MRLRQLFFIFFLLSAFASVRCAVIGIDLGTDVIKIGMRRSGAPIHIIEDETSKRSFPSLVAFFDKERLAGHDAMKMRTKCPSCVVDGILSFLGTQNPKTEEQAQCLLNPRSLTQLIADTDRNMSTAIELPPKALPTDLSESPFGTPLRPEEALGFLLARVKATAEMTGQSVRDCVLTVPPTFTHTQRKAVVEAASLASLNVLALIDTDAAAAFWYGWEKYSLLGSLAMEQQGLKSAKDVKESLEAVALFADIGAGSTRLSAVRFGPKKGTQGKKGAGLPKGPPEQVEMLFTLSDPQLGGHAFDALIVEDMLKHIQKKSTQPITPKFKARLWTAARRLKEVLSVNSNAQTQIELSDRDLVYALTRTQFNEMCKPLLARLEALCREFQDLVTQKSLKPVALEVIGGGSRVVAVKETLRRVFNRNLGNALNPDESAALGATLFAASHSQAFLVRGYSLLQKTNADLSVSIFQTAEPADLGHGKTVKLFPLGAKFPARKVMTLQRKTPFSFLLRHSACATHEASLPCGVNSHVALVRVPDVESVLAQYENVTKYAVKIGVEIDAKGAARLTDITLETEVTQVSYIMPKNKTKAAGSNATNTTTATEGVKDSDSESSHSPEDKMRKPEAAPSEAPSDPETEADGASKKEEKKAEASKVLPKMVTKQVIKRAPIPHTLEWLSVPPLTAAQRQIAQQRIEFYRECDVVKRSIAEAHNQLEEYVYSVRGLLYDEVLTEVATKEDLLQLEGELDSIVNWLYDQFNPTSPAPFTERYRAIRLIAHPIVQRYKEHRDRPGAVEEAFAAVRRRSNATETLHSKGSLNDTELDQVNVLTGNFTAWLQSSLATQVTLPLTANPHLTVEQVHKELAQLEAQCDKLLKQAAQRIRSELAAEAKRKREEAKNKKEEAEAQRREEEEEEEEEGEQEVGKKPEEEEEEGEDMRRREEGGNMEGEDLPDEL